MLARTGLTRVRELHKMARPLSSADACEPIPIPDGFALRAFERGRDEDSWVSVNAEAFADHPEQGRVTRADLDRLTGATLVRSRGPAPPRDHWTGTRCSPGSHWTKVDPTAQVVDRDGRLAPAGEVYVVAVAPRFHGRGLAVPLTRAGLRHLAGRGLRDVVLYVDGDNEPALRTYRRLGFESILVDGMYVSRH